jgi:hypothetical protein
MANDNRETRRPLPPSNTVAGFFVALLDGYVASGRRERGMGRHDTPDHTSRRGRNDTRRNAPTATTGCSPTTTSTQRCRPDREGPV